MASQDHIKWLLEGNDKWNTRRDSHSFRPDFRFSNIYENFRKAGELDHNGRVPLNRFNLSDANFDGAILKNVDLHETSLSGAQMGVKSLDGTSFSETDLTEAQFGSWFFEGMNFGYATLKDTNFIHIRAYRGGFNRFTTLEGETLLRAEHFHKVQTRDRCR